MNEIIVAVVSGLCVAIPSILTTLKSSKANSELIEYKISDLKEDMKVLNEKVQLHNNFGIKLAKLEENINNLKQEFNEMKRK